MADHEIDLDIDLSPRPRKGSGRLVALIGLLVLVGLGAVAVRNAAGRDPESDTPARDDAQVDENDGDREAVAIDAAGRYDGLDSIRLPLEVTPDAELVDGMEVRARGAGYTPNAMVAIIQCAALSDGTGSVNNCDLSNYVLGSADDQGFVDMTLTVHRYIANADGEVDCAQQTVACSIAIGNIADYDESGVVDVWFDGNVDGVRSPVISVTPTVGIRDGDPLTVTGANFAPGDSVQLSQCVIGGSRSFDSCFFGDLVTDTVTADADGAFTAVVTARRQLEGGVDCFDDVYGCRLAAHGTTDAPNPVGLHFDGSVRPAGGVSLVIDPGFDLFDGAVVSVRLDQVPIDGEVELRQCVDQGSLGVSCGPVVTASVVDGAATASFVIEQFLTNADGALVDCAAPGRVCEFRVSGAHEQTVPLRFAGES